MKKINITSAVGVRYNLYGSIDAFSNYASFFEDVYTYKRGDKILLHINSPGGNVDVGTSIINAIHNCDAEIHAVIEGPSYSMASLIAMACDKIRFTKYSFLMFHNYSGGGYGKGAELFQNINEYNQYFNDLLNEYCYPFLTRHEINKIAQDGDVYVRWDDANLAKRIERHYK